MDLHEQRVSTNRSLVTPLRSWSLDQLQPVQEHRGTIVDGGLTVRISNLALPLVETVALSCTLVGPALAQPCATDSDCAAALSCKSPGKECSQGAMLLPDGGTYVTQPICETLPSKCTWVLSACQADSDCALPNWGCLLFPNQATVKVCFPEQKSCSTTQACPASYHLPELGFRPHHLEENQIHDFWNVDAGVQHIHRNRNMRHACRVRKVVNQ